MTNRYFFRCRYCRTVYASKQGMKPINGRLACRACQGKIHALVTDATAKKPDDLVLTSFELHKLRQLEAENKGV